MHLAGGRYRYAGDVERYSQFGDIGLVLSERSGAEPSPIPPSNSVIVRNGDTEWCDRARLLQKILKFMSKKIRISSKSIKILTWFIIGLEKKILKNLQVNSSFIDFILKWKMCNHINQYLSNNCERKVIKASEWKWTDVI